MLPATVDTAETSKNLIVYLRKSPAAGALASTETNLPSGIALTSNKLVSSEVKPERVKLLSATLPPAVVASFFKFKPETV